MFAHFLTFRRGQNCGAVFSKLSAPVIYKREDEEKATVLGELLLQNCSVAIDDVYEPDSIPLPEAKLESFRIAASSSQANPPATPASGRPTTAALGSATAQATISRGNSATNGPKGASATSAGKGLSATSSGKGSSVTPAAGGIANIQTYNLWTGTLLVGLGFLLSIFLF